MDASLEIVEFTFDIAFSLIAQDEQRVVARMPIHERMLNPVGTVHAGAMIWFADVAATRLARVANGAAGERGAFPVAVNIQAAVLGNQRGGALTAEARFVRRGKRVTVIRTTVTGEEGKLLLELTTTHVPATG